MPGAELVGRDEVLALAARRWSEVTAGQGQTLLIAGEAGIGKSRILNEIVSLVGGAPVVRAMAWPQDADAPGALLLDIASGLRRAGRADAADRLAGLLDAGTAEGETAAIARRRLVGSAAELLIETAQRSPSLLEIDDLQWGDELSLDVLQRAAVAAADIPLLIVGGYRTDELSPGAAAARWRARLLQSRTAEEARLPRLDAAATAELTASLIGQVPSAEQAAALYARSNGIPLHVEELVAAGSDAGVPETVAQAVQLRAAELSPNALALAEAAAVVGRAADARLLAAASGLDPEELDAGLTTLIDVHFLEADPTAGSVDFRHALIRDAISERIAPSRRRALHARVAAAGAGAGLSDAELSDHFERAGLNPAAFRHALTAAATARRADAHREVARLTARAIRTAPRDLPGIELARLHAQLAREQQTIDENAQAAAEFDAAAELFRTDGDVLEALALIPAMNAVRYRLGESLEQRVERARAGLRELDGLPAEEAAALVRSALHTALAGAYMLARHLEESIVEAEIGLAMTRDRAEESALDVNLGSVLVFAGRTDEGWALMERGIQVAEAGEPGLESAAARGYQMLGTSASVLVDYDRAERYLDAGLSLTEAAEIWHENHYLHAHRAHVRWATGDPSATTEAAQALADAGSQITEITARYVLGYAAMGRGDAAEAVTQLEGARELASGMAELQRLSPALWGLAENALLRGEPDRAIALTQEAAALSAAVQDAAYLFPHVLTGTRARLLLRERDGASAWVAATTEALRHRSIPGTLPAIDHSEGLIALQAGRLDDARELLERARDDWDALRRFWEGTWARLDLARLASRARRPGEAAGLLDEVRRRAVDAGAPVFARLASEAAGDGTGAHPASGPLTEREYEVARLIAAGATNREIAERLVISPKTVSTHVEHILAKLHVARRAEVAAWVAKAD